MRTPVWRAHVVCRESHQLREVARRHSSSTAYVAAQSTMVHGTKKCRLTLHPTSWALDYSTRPTPSHGRQCTQRRPFARRRSRRSWPSVTVEERSPCSSRYLRERGERSTVTVGCSAMEGTAWVPYEVEVGLHADVARAEASPRTIRTAGCLRLVLTGWHQHPHGEYHTDHFMRLCPSGTRTK